MALSSGIVKLANRYMVGRTVLIYSRLKHSSRHGRQESILHIDLPSYLQAGKTCTCLLHLGKTNLVTPIHRVIERCFISKTYFFITVSKGWVKIVVLGWHLTSRRVWTLSWLWRPWTSRNKYLSSLNIMLRCAAVAQSPIMAMFRRIHSHQSGWQNPCREAVLKK